MPEWGIAIISMFVGTLLGFVLNLCRDKLQEKQNKKQEALEKHFEELKKTIILEILTIVSGVINDYGTLEASTLRGNRTMEDAPFPLLFGFEERDEYQAFQSHYPKTDKTWRGLITQIWEQNEDVNVALEEIREYINNNPDLPLVKVYYPPTEEKVMTETVTLIYQAIYSIAHGEQPLYDFSKLHVSDYEKYQQISVADRIIAITDKEKTEKCKFAFLELQTSKQFRDRALGLGGNAFQIKMSLETLAYGLNDIYSYGLVSNKEGQKFEPNKYCKICNSLFYKKS
jgi:hypothetical protein